MFPKEEKKTLSITLSILLLHPFYEIMGFCLFLSITQEMTNEKVKEGPEQPLLFGLWKEDRAVQPGIFSTEVQTPLSFPATMCKFKKNNFNVKVSWWLYSEINYFSRYILKLLYQNFKSFSIYPLRACELNQASFLFYDF